MKNKQIKLMKRLPLSLLLILGLMSGCANSETKGSGHGSNNEDDTEVDALVVGGSCDETSYNVVCSVDGLPIVCNGGKYVQYGSCDGGKVCINGECKLSGSGTGGTGDGGSGTGGTGDGGSGNGGTGTGGSGNGGTGTGGSGNGGTGEGSGGNGGSPINVKCEGFASTCANPMLLAEGEKKTVKSACGESSHLGSKCNVISSSLSDPEGVFKVSIDKTGYYDFNFVNNRSGAWAVYMSSACDGEDMVMRDWCSEGSDNYAISSKLMNAGDYYIFIENENDEDSTAEVQMSYKKSSSQAVIACIAEQEKPATGEIIDFSDRSAHLEFDGNTEKGTKLWSMAAGASLPGHDVIYSFHLDQTAKVKAVLSDVKPVTENRTNLGNIYLYFAECDNVNGLSYNGGAVYSRNMSYSTYSSSAADSFSVSLVSAEAFNPGTYNLVVDSSSSYDFTYKLTVWLIED